MSPCNRWVVGKKEKSPSISDVLFPEHKLTEPLSKAVRMHTVLEEGRWMDGWVGEEKLGDQRTKGRHVKGEWRKRRWEGWKLER